MNPKNRSTRTRIYKGNSKKKGNGNKFILTKYLFPIAKREKKVKKKKININPIIFLIFDDIYFLS